MRHLLSDIDLISKRATCSVCGPDVKHIKVGKPPRRICTNTVEATSKRAADRRYHDEHVDNRPGKHGLTRKEASDRRAGKVCEICGGNDQTVVDHNHATGALRGILCRKHNIGLALLGDGDFETLRAVIQYLKRYDQPNP